MTIRDRATGWLTPLFHADFREVLLHTLVRYRLLCPVYCLMPNHVHMLLRGIAPDADQQKAAAFLRRHVGKALRPFAWQTQPYDHVLRKEALEREAFRSTAYYIAEHRVRAGLVASASEYPFSGGVLPGKPRVNIHHPRYWDVFWEMHERLLRANGYQG
jgi:putative transposase